MSAVALPNKASDEDRANEAGGDAASREHWDRHSSYGANSVREARFVDRRGRRAEMGGSLGGRRVRGRAENDGGVRAAAAAAAGFVVVALVLLRRLLILAPPPPSSLAASVVYSPARQNKLIPKRPTVVGSDGSGVGGGGGGGGGEGGGLGPGLGGGDSGLGGGDGPGGFGLGGGYGDHAMPLSSNSQKVHVWHSQREQ